LARLDRSPFPGGGDKVLDQPQLRVAFLTQKDADEDLSTVRADLKGSVEHSGRVTGHSEIMNVDGKRPTLRCGVSWACGGDNVRKTSRGLELCRGRNFDCADWTGRVRHWISELAQGHQAPLNGFANVQLGPVRSKITT
jgi:hypothetical protein